MNIDLKAFNDEYYKKICGGSLQPIFRTIETYIYCLDLNDKEKKNERYICGIV